MKQQLKLVALIASISAFSLTACDESSSTNSPQYSEFNGIWDREGYGEILVIKNQTLDYYQYTQTDCLLVDRAISGFNESGKLSLENTDKLIFSATENAVFVQNYRRLESLPDRCVPENLTTQSTPQAVFDFFAQSYSDYYAFFEQREIDWPAIMAAVQGSVSNQMSEEELFLALATALSEIDDGHVMLQADDEIYRPVKARGANRVIEETFAEQTEFDDIQAYANYLTQAYWQNLQSYFDEDSAVVVDGYLPARLLAATINNGKTGYLMITSMAYFTGNEEGLDLDANLEFVEENFPQLMAMFDTTESLVIDIRFNTGGIDEVALKFASQFFDQDTLIGSKYALSALGESAQQQAWVQGMTSSAYLKPIVIITGEETASAAEVFTLAMKQLPNVAQIGAITAGMLSDVLERELPNGWQIWLANEVYQDPLGNQFEAVGFAPDHAVETFSPEAIESGKNSALDLALELLN